MFYFIKHMLKVKVKILYVGLPVIKVYSGSACKDPCTLNLSTKCSSSFNHLSPKEQAPSNG
jgi:hypothetical protein